MAKDLVRTQDVDIDPAETSEWLESLEYVLKNKGPARVEYLLSILDENAQRLGIELPYTQTTPFITFTVTEECPDFGTLVFYKTAVIEIFHETGTVDGHDRAKSHGNRWVFPEVRHQPGMGIA